MTSDPNASQHHRAIQQMLARTAAITLPLHEQRAERCRRRAGRTRSPLMRLIFTRRAERAERRAKRLREQIARADGQRDG